MFALLLSLLAAPAPAQGVDGEITVYDDLFERWDGTRWLIQTEVGLPVPMTLMASQNLDFRTNRFQARAVLACDKDWKLRGRRYEVSCTIEDIALRATALQKERADAGPILDEYDQSLTGKRLQLQVKHDGRVANVDLEGLEKGNRRKAQIHESLRQILMRLVVGYDMRLRDMNDLSDGEWIEHNPRLMTMPSGSGSQGSSMVVHVLRRMDGHVTVASEGRGVIAEAGNTYKTTYSGVSVYDFGDGYMTERVWSLIGRATASSWVGEAGEGLYLHLGRLRLLDEAERPDLGTTGLAAPPGAELPGLASWAPLE